MRCLRVMWIIALFVGIATLTIRAEVPTSMNIQGKLLDTSGDPASPGYRVFTFKIYDAQTNGNEIWPGGSEEEQTIFVGDDGLWKAHIGAEVSLTGAVFADSSRWLEIAVDDGINPVNIMPRTKLNTTAYSFHALMADTSAVALSVDVNAVDSVGIRPAGISFSDIAQNGAAAGQIMKWNGSGWNAADDEGGSGTADNDWTLAGDVLFTADEWGVARAGNMLFGANDSTHINLGVSCTTGTAGEDYVYIAVGGGIKNAAMISWSTIAGGEENRVGSWNSTIGGGFRNTVPFDNTVGFSTIAGGGYNTVSKNYSTISGGWENAALFDGATVGGGSADTAGGTYTTVSGGQNNVAIQNWCTIGGGFGNRVSDTYATVSGGKDNKAEAYAAVVGGGDRNAATRDLAHIGGGWFNEANGVWATVSGGDSCEAGGDWSAVGGGWFNTAGEPYSFVGGGHSNLALDTAASVCGGRQNRAYGIYASIGGGRNNRARGLYSVIAGGGGPGLIDSNLAAGDFSSIGGGTGNISGGEWSTIGGGCQNRARGWLSVIGGGGGPFSGDSNSALGDYSVIGGGQRNNAAGEAAVIPGGRRNNAFGIQSAALGSNARAYGTGTVIISATMSTLDSVVSETAAQIVLRADSGLYLTNRGETAPHSNANLITTRGGAYLSGSGTTWTNSCDRNCKENFAGIDRNELLAKVAQLPITQWNYKEESDVTHIGPVAQDFYELFGTGKDDRHIATVDADGIALAAIQALYAENRELKKQLDALQAVVARMLEQQ